MRSLAQDANIVDDGCHSVRGSDTVRNIGAAPKLRRHLARFRRGHQFSANPGERAPRAWFFVTRWMINSAGSPPGMML
jgi:hypothetical protein